VELAATLAARLATLPKYTSSSLFWTGGELRRGERDAWSRFRRCAGRNFNWSGAGPRRIRTAARALPIASGQQARITKVFRQPGYEPLSLFKCGASGGQLELWAKHQQMTVYEAAVELCGKLGIDVPWVRRW
jgi:hypothetical protein